MGLLQTMCRLFGSRCAGEPEPTKESMRTATTSSQADLGQKEAEMEKSGKEQMSHMEGGTTAQSTQRP